MGICISREQDESPELAHSRALDKQLRTDEKQMSKEAKLLLLGAYMTMASLL